jgi:hypothetical protein
VKNLRACVLLQALLKTDMRTLFLILLAIFLTGAFAACRMDNKNNMEDYSSYSNEDKAKLGADSAVRDHTKVENDTLPE